ncbi:hypothetical protein N1851_011278 [Merluccius polli]|uniref:Uncharacterized protein n=1 Tax=Merluccius polli TaxID=89951 RepID=A0AA47MX98_MERPO|nr:hypothetical protein N1851_011278 [Merluccius polli]
MPSQQGLMKKLPAATSTPAPTKPPPPPPPPPPSSSPHTNSAMLKAMAPGAATASFTDKEVEDTT